MNKKVTEPYLVDALSFTEAEARIIEEMTRSSQESLPYQTSNGQIIVNCSLVKKTRPTVGLNANWSFITLMKKRCREENIYPSTGTGR